MIWQEICKLPSDIIGFSVFSFICPHEIALLDLALVTPNNRAQLLCLLKAVQSVVLIQPYKNSLDALKWFLKRGVHVDRFIIDEKHIECLEFISNYVNMIDNIHLECLNAFITHQVSNMLTDDLLQRKIYALQTNLRKDSIDYLSGNLMNLSYLKKFTSSAGFVPESWLLNLLTSNPDLQSLSIAQDSPGLSDQFYHTLGDKCHNLTELCLYSVVLNDTRLDIIGNTCKLLQGVRFADDWGGAPNAISRFTTDGIVRLAKSCKHLETVIFSSKCLTPTSLIPFVRYCRHLKKLSSETPGVLSPMLVDALVEADTHLLELRGIWKAERSQSYANWGRAFASLQKLFLPFSGSLPSGSALAHVAHSFGALETLVLQVDTLPLDLLWALARGTRNLKLLLLNSSHLCNCRVELAAVIRSNPSLENLYLRGQLSISDCAVFALSTCKNLSQFSASITNIVSGIELSDASVIELAEQCPNLTDLDGVQCASLTDASVYALARCCPKLRMLTLDKCFLVTETALSEIMLRCTSLIKLHVCARTISADAVRRLHSIQKRFSEEEFFILRVE